MANYPTSIPSFTSKSAGQTIASAHMNSVQDEVVAIGTVLVNSLNVASNAVTSVKFPASQSASSDANTLDDYEEGTWTPTIVSAGGGTPTYAVQVGSYTKVGNLVRIQGRITLSAFNTLAAGNVSIGGLPFASANVTNDYGGMAVHFFANMTTTITMLTGYIQPNDSTIVLQHTAGVAAGTTSTNKTDLSAAVDLIFTAHYHVA